jgi:TonB family protein
MVLSATQNASGGKTFSMIKREKFGKFVLLEQVETSPLASEHRAAKLGPAGLEKIVSVHRLSTQLAANADVVKSLMDQVKFASQLQNPNIVKIYGIGKVDSTYYISYEFMEGKSLKAIFSRCRQDGFPFSVDHGLLIVSKLCSALEYAHTRKSEAGSRYFHGLVSPANVLVSYEGEVRLRGFGYWPSRIREAKALIAEEALYLAPEQAAGGLGDTRSDAFALGAILFETLTGEPLRKGEGALDVPARLVQARLQSPSTEDDAMPKPIAAILQRALAADPAARYPEIQEMRKAIDTLLFSGDFTPTTFNLAFFMHSLFREDLEQESKVLKEEKEASYAEYVTEEAPASATGSGPAAGAAPPLHTDTQAFRPAAAVAEAETTIVPSPLREPPAARPAPSVPPAPAQGLGAKAAASGFTFHRDDGKDSRLPLIAGAAGVLLVLGAVGVVVMRRSHAPAASPAPAASTLSSEAVAAQAKVKELQEKLASLEAEKAAAEAKAAEDAKKKIEAQAAAKGQSVDPAALARAQEEARKKAQAEQERRAQEEKQRLEAAKAAEEARLAEEKKKADEEAARTAAAAATTLPAVTTPLAPAAATQPGTLVNLADAGVIAPLLERKGALQYPPIALRQHVEGTVELNVLVDEKGGVTDAKVLNGVGGRAGLNEAAIDYAKRQRYRPATKEGVPVKVWMPLRVKFELPR